MESPLYFICTIGFSMAFFVLLFNKGYKNANKFLAGYLFFASLYMMQNFVLIYSKSVNLVLLFTLTQPFFYLIGPFAFLHIRSLTTGRTKLSLIDILHFILFIICLIGLVPYYFSSWDYKLAASVNIIGENWSTNAYNLNFIFRSEVDQILNLIQIFFYTLALWNLSNLNKKGLTNNELNSKQLTVINKYVIIFCTIFTLICIDFFFAIWNILVYQNKSEFIYQTNFIVFIATFIYLAMNFSILFFPRIMTGMDPER